MKIIETNDEIAKKIEKIFIKKIYEDLLPKAIIIEEKVKQENLIIWRKSATYKSLISGDLNHEFGFPKGEAKLMVDRVLDQLTNSVTVVPKLRRLKSGLTVAMQILVFQKKIDEDVFSGAYSNITYTTEGTDFGDFGGMGSTVNRLPWLEWLLKEGNSYLVYDFVYLDKASKNSRSGRGIMKYEEGGAWKVPAEHSGTLRNNWLTRELYSHSAYLSKKYGEIINEVINS